MNDETPTRSRLIALTDERRTMREGYAFLDEKCLLLAGEMLRQVRRVQALRQTLAQPQAAASLALGAALARHGLDGLQVLPCAARPGPVRLSARPLLGVTLLQATLEGPTSPAPPAVYATAEAEACRAAFGALAAPLVELAALSASLARLLAEYRRTVRRVRALQDVLLPELDRTIADIDTRLEDLEREDALALRSRH